MENLNACQRSSIIDNKEQWGMDLLYVGQIFPTKTQRFSLWHWIPTNKWSTVHLFRLEIL
jgi:hypothetical protein